MDREPTRRDAPEGLLQDIAAAIEICSSIPGVVAFDSSAHKPVFESLRKRNRGPLPLLHESYAFQVQSLRHAGHILVDGDHWIGLSFGLNGKAAVAVSPIGPAASEKVAMIAKHLKDAGIQLFVKKIHPSARNGYMSRKFIDADLWHDFDLSEVPDDVYPEVITHCHKYNIANPGSTMSDIRRMVGNMLPEPDYEEKMFLHIEGDRLVVFPEDIERYSRNSDAPRWYLAEMAIGTGQHRVFPPFLDRRARAGRTFLSCACAD